jgi:hypothetical protein
MTMIISKGTLAAAACAAAALASGCGGAASAQSQPGTATLPQGSEPVTLDPGAFTTTIDNPWWPMRPGSRWVYRETDTQGTDQRVVVTVTNRTKRIADGITARVVSDVATEHGRRTEVTDDWYAQDADGNVWYLGEATAAHSKGGKVDRHGSFEAGVHGAQPGIAIPADAKPGLSYRQEYLKGVAEDRGAVVTVGEEQAGVPAGFFKGVLMTRDLEPTEPKVQELKFYARGVGPVLSLHTDGPGERAALVSYTRGHG